MDNSVAGENEAYVDFRQDVRTLDFWRGSLVQTPSSIECRVMRLEDKNGQAYFEGPGRIEIEDEMETRFFMHGNAVDEAGSFERLLAGQKNPYDTGSLLRLVATDYRDVVWSGGWTSPELPLDFKRGWPLRGGLLGIQTLATGHWVSPRSGVELLVAPAVDLPCSEILRTTIELGGELVSTATSPGRQIVDVLDTKIAFSYDPSGSSLLIAAQTSAKLQHPYAENWLMEPLRILLGRHVFPRLVARNLGDGRAHVWLRPAPRDREHSPIALLQPFSMESGRAEEFWALYADILTMIAEAGGFERHKLTRIYEELAETRRGSRWVLTMSLASAVESLANDIITDADRTSEFSSKDLESMKTHIAKWTDDAQLRGRMLSNLGLVSRRSVVAFMRGLAKNGSVDATQVQTWYEIRNSVMHGHMVDSSGSDEGDRNLDAMLALLHDLTRLVIRKSPQVEATGSAND